jgi:hypothetical protein
VDIFNYTNNCLIDIGFVPYELDEIQGLGAVIYKTSVNHVVMKKIHTNEELNNIGSFSTKIRNIMLNEGVNTSNTYLFICVDEPIEYETFFLIERNTTSLRKYVLRNEIDLNRIPFLDIKSEEVGNSVGKIKENQEQNFYLQKVYEFITSHNGYHNKLSTNEIERSVKMIIDLVEERYEN